MDLQEKIVDLRNVLQLQKEVYEWLENEDNGKTLLDRTGDMLFMIGFDAFINSYITESLIDLLEEEYDEEEEE
jgi:hypothetical protein